MERKRKSKMCLCDYAKNNMKEIGDHESEKFDKEDCKKKKNNARIK